jgi:hypothetical protein
MQAADGPNSSQFEWHQGAVKATVYMVAPLLLFKGIGQHVGQPVTGRVR